MKSHWPLGVAIMLGAATFGLALGPISSAGQRPPSGAANAQGQSGAEEVVSKPGRFTATFPAKPRAQEPASSDKAVHKQLVYLAQKDGTFFLVRCMVYTKEVAEKLDGRDPAEFARQQRELTVKNTPDKVLSQKAITVGEEKRPGYELLIEEAKGFGRVRAVYANGRLYSLLVGGPTREVVTGAEADRFFASFRITK